MDWLLRFSRSLMFDNDRDSISDNVAETSSQGRSVRAASPRISSARFRM